MKVQEIQSEFIIYDVPDSNKHKKILLKLIDEIPNNPYEQVTKTDWNLPKDFERKYQEYFYSQVAAPYAKEMMKYFKVEKYEINKLWFQQYEEKSLHCYHTHALTNFTSVYFLELPESRFKTSIKIKDKEYNYEAGEGQIITFPAHLLHASKANGNLRKTIISFNSNLLLPILKYGLST